MEIEPALVERMVALVRDAADMDEFNCYAVSQVAQTIVAELPKPVDPDVEEAERLVYELEGCSDGLPRTIALAAIKRGRELALQESTR